MVNQGRGKGIATYYSSEFQVSGTINKENYQMLKLKGVNFDVINVYCSRGASKRQLFEDLLKVKGDKFCIIVGDFNDNFLQQPKSQFVQQMAKQKFKQPVTTPTHLEGAILDHVYIQNAKWELKVDINFRHYSDHAAISLVKDCCSK